MRRIAFLVVPSLVAVATLPAQMIGPYTINPTWPASSINFVSLADATTALAAQGVAGPVDFLLYDDAGPFNEASPFTTANTGGGFGPSTAVLTMASWIGASATNRITWKPALGERPVFDATGRAMGVFWGGADYVTLQGIEIRNAPFDGICLYAEATHGIAQDPIIDGCAVHDCGGTGVTIYGNTPQPANTLVQNCTFWRCQLTNAGAFNQTGRFGYISSRRSNGTRIVHNTFVMDAGVGGLLCVLGAYPSGAAELPFAEISNNIIVKSTAAIAPMLRFQSPAGSTAPLPLVCDSNCWHDTSGGPFALWGTNATTVSATLLDWQTNALRDFASLQADPMFRDAANHDYHLAGNSPCIAASSVAANVGNDRDGQTRSTPLEIGADEFTAGTWVSIGSGCSGGSSLVAALATDEPFLGNTNYGLHTSNVQPGLITALFGSLGLAQPPIPLGNCTVYLDPASAINLSVGIAGVGGTTSTVFGLPPNPAFINFHVSYQSLVLDVGAPLGFTLSNALDVVFSF